MARKEHWKTEPDPHDYPAASAYLSLTLGKADVAAVVRKLKAAPISHGKAKDLSRASRLPLQPMEDLEVMRVLKKVRKGEMLSPVLLVRGDLPQGVPLIVADGYHRICASYHISDDADIPFRIVDSPLS